MASFDRSPAQYSLVAHVDTSSERLTVWMDLVYLNQSGADLRRLALEIPEGTAFHLDSILAYGTPINSTRIQLSGPKLDLALPVNAGEMLPLQFSFSFHVAGLRELAQNGGSLLIDDWYPVLLVQDSGVTAGRPEIADIRLELAADSLFRILAPGTWVNEIELIGFIPDRADTTISDLLDRNPITKSKLNHFFRLTGAPRMPIAFTCRGTLTRIQFEQQRFDLYAAASVEDAYRSEFLNRAGAITRMLVARLGALPDGRIAMLAGKEGRSDSEASRLVYVSLASRDPDIILAEFTWGIASQYFNNTAAPGSGMPWSEGAAVYLTVSILEELFPGRGYKMAGKWLDYRLPPREVRNPLVSAPFGWMNKVRRPNRPFGSEDSTRFVELFVVPSALQVVAAGTSVDAVNALLRRYSLEVRHRHAAADELLSLIRDELGDEWGAWLEEFRQHRRPFDWGITTVSTERSGNGYAVTISTVANALSDIPLEFALIKESDTLFARYTPVDSVGQRTPFITHTDFAPTLVLLDPHHLLPDNNRQNNLYMAGKHSGRYTPKRGEFPTFRRLTLGD